LRIADPTGQYFKLLLEVGRLPAFVRFLLKLPSDHPILAVAGINASDKE
jgi:hypothetical protein